MTDKSTAHDIIADFLAGEMLKPVNKIGLDKKIWGELVPPDPDGLPRIIHVSLDALACAASVIIVESHDYDKSDDMFLRVVEEALMRLG